MPKPRIQIHFEKNQNQNFNTEKTAFSAQLIGLSIHDNPADIEFIDTAIAKKVWNRHVRLNLIAEADTVWTTLQNITTTAKGKISYHKCSHDDAEVYDCKLDPRSEWQEKTF